jgi:hypothetical protein
LLGDIPNKMAALEPLDRFQIQQILNNVENYNRPDKNVIQRFFIREINACLNTYYRVATENRTFLVCMDTLKTFAREYLGMQPRDFTPPLSPMPLSTVSELPPTPTAGVMPTRYYPRTP